MSKPRRGRPPVPAADRHDVRVELKVTAAEHAAWTAVASDKPLGAWLRDVANRAAKRSRR